MYLFPALVTVSRLHLPTCVIILIVFSCVSLASCFRFLITLLGIKSTVLPLVSVSVPVILSCRILSSCDLWFQICVAFFGYCFVLCVLFAISLIKRLPFRESCLPPASKFYILYILLQIVCIDLSIS